VKACKDSEALKTISQYLDESLRGSENKEKSLKELLRYLKPSKEA